MHLFPERHKEQWINEGEAYRKAQRNNEAIAAYDQAIALDPNFALAYKERGNVYYGLKQYTRAIADYTRAIELDPNYALAYSNRGAVYNALKNYQAALADYTRALVLNRYSNLLLSGVIVSFRSP